MKIDRPAVKHVAEAYRVGQPPVGGRPGALAARPQEMPADGLNLSATAREASTLRSRLREAPAVRIDLVERIKARVEAGTYNVNPRAVAERILQSKVLDQ
ncbi:MAG: Anti-sigma-28 factor, FlgM [Symbiobacteriaceae bacterium]|jgi:flagellar biosynthesis anti-sigma factor FlgM|nr:Anti-sigma-28 factor, FlgM [Symbiobacteriaceae bacterium]